MYDNQKYTRKYNKMYNIYIYGYIANIKCLYKWQKVTSLGSLSSKKPRISVETDRYCVP